MSRRQPISRKSVGFLWKGDSRTCWKYQMEPGTSDRECGGTSEAKYKTVLANFAENIIGLVLSLEGGQVCTIYSHPWSVRGSLWRLRSTHLFNVMSLETDHYKSDGCQDQCWKDVVTINNHGGVVTTDAFSMGCFNQF